MNSIATYLYGLYYSVREAVDKNQNEASQRRGVDLLIQLVFSSRKEGVHDVWYVCILLALFSYLVC
jgi:hypothetical protein